MTEQPPSHRPVFVPPADWPTNAEIVEHVLCRKWPGGCQCDGPRPCEAGRALFAGEALAIVEALADHSRLISPLIERPLDAAAPARPAELEDLLTVLVARLGGVARISPGELASVRQMQLQALSDGPVLIFRTTRTG